MDVRKIRTHEFFFVFLYFRAFVILFSIYFQSDDIR